MNSINSNDLGLLLAAGLAIIIGSVLGFAFHVWEHSSDKS